MLQFLWIFFAEVEGGILGLLQLPAGQAAVCQLAKTAEEVVNSVSWIVDEMVYLEEDHPRTSKWLPPPKFHIAPEKWWLED